MPGWWVPSDLCKLVLLRLQQSRFLGPSEVPNFTLKKKVAALYENQVLVPISWFSLNFLLLNINKPQCIRSFPLWSRQKHAEGHIPGWKWVPREQGIPKEVGPCFSGRLCSLGCVVICKAWPWDWALQKALQTAKMC